MLATFSQPAFLGDCPPSLARRKIQAHMADAQTTYGVTVLDARQQDQTWWQLALDVRKSTPQGVYAFLTLTGVVSVSLQPQDADCYLAQETELVRSMVKANFSQLASGEFTPDEITTKFHEMAMTCVTYRPVEKRIDDGTSDYNLDGTYRGKQADRDAAYMEFQQAQDAADKEAQRPTKDAWGFWNE